MMSKNKIGKILILLLVLGMIMLQTCKVIANSQDLSSILAEDGSDSSAALNGTGTNGTNSNLNNAINGTNNKGANNNGVGSVNKNNTSLPKTGTNENIIIGLMVICTLAGVYAFKKVKDYNM